MCNRVVSVLVGALVIGTGCGHQQEWVPPVAQVVPPPPPPPPPSCPEVCAGAPAGGSYCTGAFAPGSDCRALADLVRSCGCPATADVGLCVGLCFVRAGDDASAIDWYRPIADDPAAPMYPWGVHNVLVHAPDSPADRTMRRAAVQALVDRGVTPSWSAAPVGGAPDGTETGLLASLQFPLLADEAFHRPVRAADLQALWQIETSRPMAQCIWDAAIRDPTSVEYCLQRSASETVPTICTPMAGGVQAGIILYWDGCFPAAQLLGELADDCSRGEGIIEDQAQTGNLVVGNQGDIPLLVATTYCLKRTGQQDKAEYWTRRALELGVPQSTFDAYAVVWADVPPLHARRSETAAGPVDTTSWIPYSSQQLGFQASYPWTPTEGRHEITRGEATPLTVDEAYASTPEWEVRAGSALMGEGSPTPDELMRSAKESLQAEAGATPVETSATVRDGCNMWQASATLPGDGGDKVFLVGLLFCPQGRLFLIGGWAIPAQKGVLDAFVESFHPLPASD